MRINRDLLLKIIDDTVFQRTRKDHGIVAIYLSGSLLGDEFLLGGTTDIDLNIVHMDAPTLEREIVRLNDEIHLDIAHYAQKAFQQTRNLRLHPWHGPTIYDCKVIYDPQHFMDFTQASVRGQFNRDDYVVRRARQRVEHARQIWLGFTTAMPVGPEPHELLRYLQAVELAANAVASLNGAPLTERRLLFNFPDRAQAAGHPGLYPALLGMLGAPHADAAILGTWLEPWQSAFDGLPAETTPPRLHPGRRAYYRRAMDAQIGSAQPSQALWPLLRTWCLAAQHLDAHTAGYVGWQQACTMLGLQGDGFAERVGALDAFLDMVDEVIESWLQERGG